MISHNRVTYMDIKNMIFILLADIISFTYKTNNYIIAQIAHAQISHNRVTFMDIKRTIFIFFTAFISFSCANQ